VHKLSFTGDCDEQTFNTVCATHDFWYHSYYFDNGFEVRGDYNIGADVHDYGFPDRAGARVLDVGTGSGWFALYFEQLGAEVTTVDARGYVDFDVYGRAGNPPIEVEKSEPDDIGPDGKPLYFSPVSRGFWIMRNLLRSNVRYVNARVYELPTVFAGEKFDFVFVGALLEHLRDPIGALMAARQVCGGRLFATTPVATDGGDHPWMDLPWTHLSKIAWWRPNLPCFRQWFLAAGFSEVDVSRSVTLTGDKLEQHVIGEDFRNESHPLQVGDAQI